MKVSLKVLHTSNNVKGFVLYEGPSLFDGKPITVIVTLKSDNEKTGNMVQTWIMRSDMSPTDILRLKLDYSVCFKCRFSGGDGCYVNLGQGPLAIWNAYKNGTYLNIHENLELAQTLLKNRAIRIGSYGDPTAIPFQYWDFLLSFGNGINTGYTHNWEQCDKSFRSILQASCDSENEAILAQNLGWKTFTVFNPNMELPNNIGINCVNETHGKQCIDCKLCNGNKTNIVIKLHGLSYKVKRAVAALPT
jgi:hypothetical protein